MAWFSPLPPVRTGIAACSADAIAGLRTRDFAIDPYPAEAAHEFPWRHAQRPYDLIVYQFGNSSHHDYEWAYALRYPGLVVLHDTHLHHARAAFLLRERRADDYRAEFRFAEPHVPPDIAELAVAGFDSRLYYEWPMVRALAESARLLAVHGDGARAQLRARLLENGTTLSPESIVSLRLGHGEPVTPARAAAARAAVRARHGIAEDAVVFICAGGLTPEKRIPHVLRAFAAIRSYAPSAHLLLAGAAASHYDIGADARACGLTDGITITGYLQSDAELTDHLAASDVSLNLRWPTARETSGPWLRALAAGLATVITDLAHLGDVPSLDPRTWAVNAMGDRHRAPDPICIAIDILDEDHSLRLAMRRLASDAALREALGRAGQEYWTRNGTVDAMVDDYERIIPLAAARPAPDAALPRHLRDAGDRTLRALLSPFALDLPW
jgi:glycosyltransferase involved in cell wall biosynthesis